MKKTVRILALVMALMMVTLAFAACGTKLNGKYESEEVMGGKVVLEFDGEDVTYTIIIASKEVASLEATYEIEDDQITFKFAEDEDNKTLLEEVVDKPVDFEKDGDTIKIAGEKFTKVKD